METIIAIEIAPVVEDRYYRTIVYDFLEGDEPGQKLKVVREIFHCDTFRAAVDLLNQLAEDDALTLDKVHTPTKSGSCLKLVWRRPPDSHPNGECSPK